MIIKIIVLSALLSVMVGCDRHTAASDKMDLAESLMAARPDSALLILSDIESVNPVGEKETARYALLATHITENDLYAKPYEEWRDRLIPDRHEFMTGTRLAFKATHPKFIEYLEQHGLTEAELNYVCLYAIGLRGKEVGEYIKLKRHYNISSEIRRKLGIDEHHLALLLLITADAVAQVRVSGTVVDKESNKPLMSASVIVKGADGKIKKYATSKGDGGFAISLPSVAGCRL